MSEIDENATHSEEVQETKKEEVQTADDVLALFNITKETPKEEAKTEKTEDAPPTEQPKGMTVKHLKEEKFVDEKDFPEYLRKGLDRDRIEAKNIAMTQQMDEFAKLQGYKDHAELLADIPNIKKQKEQSQQTALDKQRDELLAELETAGYDRAKAEQYIDNHPLFQEGKKALERSKIESEQAETAAKWQPLYKAYPEIEKAVVQSIESKEPINAEILSKEFFDLVNRGNDPLLAYEHLNKDKLRTQTAEQARQQAIKDIKLGKRSEVEKNSSPDFEDAVPDDVASAFAAFGFGKETAKKQLSIQKAKAR